MLYNKSAHTVSSEHEIIEALVTTVFFETI